MFLPTVRSAVHSASSNGVTDYQPRHACPMCAGQVMFDPYAAALTTVQLPEGTNVVPPKADAAGNGNGATPRRQQPASYHGLPVRACRDLRLGRQPKVRPLCMPPCPFGHHGSSSGIMQDACMQASITLLLQATRWH